jgi:hypothetical protein
MISSCVICWIIFTLLHAKETSPNSSGDHEPITSKQSNDHPIKTPSPTEESIANFGMIQLSKTFDTSFDIYWRNFDAGELIRVERKNQDIFITIVQLKNKKILSKKNVELKLDGSIKVNEISKMLDAMVQSFPTFPVTDWEYFHQDRIMDGKWWGLHYVGIGSNLDIEVIELERPLDWHREFGVKFRDLHNFKTIYCNFVKALEPLIKN